MDPKRERDLGAPSLRRRVTGRALIRSIIVSASFQPCLLFFCFLFFFFFPRDKLANLDKSPSRRKQSDLRKEKKEKENEKNKYSDGQITCV